jgi:hypothetical protein
LTNLRSASTTINITLSKGACGGSPNSNSSYFASPGIKGLYGKKPSANVKIATGMSALAAASKRFDLEIVIVAGELKPGCNHEITWLMLILWPEAIQRLRYSIEAVSNFEV